MPDSASPSTDVFDAGGRGMQHHGLRRTNQKAVLTVVGFNWGVSNADISRFSGLAPQTVSAIVMELEQSGLVERGPVLRGRRGQPATPIFIRADGAFAIGVELGWKHLDLVLLNMHAQVLAQRRQDYAFPRRDVVVDAIARFAGELTEALPGTERARLQDIGVAMPGHLEHNLERLGASSADVADWRDFDLSAELAARTGLVAHVFNDGNAACWAELIALDRPRPTNILYFLISHFLAAGVIANGALWEGPTGNAANLGSMMVHDGSAGELFAHDAASLSALFARTGIAPGQLQSDNWVESDAAPQVRAWIEAGARVMSRVVFNTTTVIEAPLVVLDTVLAPSITRLFVERLTGELYALGVGNFTPPRIVPGRHGRLAPAIGAAELPLFRRYF
ncbi:MAG: ROK family transcriptional regulator [Devosia sp.]|uniref:ROK family transcriptional regulator n=1 Tax=Devosia sp. TaxID=1871048 RepID=UPI0024C7A280|nr:ROK family transcriptional regulator [Devosia sp.]UYN99078.1 MAG: ROK family transcriptional regulator [Devosia sp.]